MIEGGLLRVNLPQSYLCSTNAKESGGVVFNFPSNIANNFSRNVPGEGILSEHDLKILWVARTLTNIELQCEAALARLEHSCSDKDLRDFIKGQLLSKFRERREPYVALLEELRSRHHQSFAA